LEPGRSPPQALTAPALSHHLRWHTNNPLTGGDQRLLESARACRQSSIAHTRSESRSRAQRTASRRPSSQAGKSDEIDALAVARAVVKDGSERFPAAYLDERATEIRLLSDHRDQLVAERVRIQNRLRWHLLALCPELEAQLPKAGPRAPRGARADRKAAANLQR
jgi:Transposase